MHEICCKLEENKQPVCKGEVCNNFGGCQYKNICGAKKPIQKVQYEGIKQEEIIKKMKVKSYNML